jgi:hypothetical protein
VMSVDAAAAVDRLPWLPDEPAPKPTRRRGGAAIAVAAAAILGVGGGAFWMGARSIDEIAPPPTTAPRASTTVKLPEARPSRVPATQVEPIVGAPIPIVEDQPRVRHVPVRVAKVHKRHKAPAHAAKPIVIAKEDAPLPPQPWPVRIIDGASGRLVRIGAFVSPHQAKRGWWAITKVNPALKRLPALVVPVQSLRNGRVYYRLQMGTTSQAHSAVLCQRMRMIAQSCVVIGAAGMA